jgi:hypothetical protein
MIIEIVFVVSLIAYICFVVVRVLFASFENDLVTSMTVLASKMREGDSLETGITHLSRGKRLSAWFFGRIITKVRKGMSLSEAFQCYESKTRSTVLAYLSKLVSVCEGTEQGISAQLEEVSTKMLKLKQLEDQLRAKTIQPVIILQLMALFGAPLFVLSLHGFLEVPLSALVTYYMGFVVVVYSLLDYAIYQDVLQAVFSLPVFLAGYGIVVTRLVPFVLRLFEHFWVM